MHLYDSELYLQDVCAVASMIEVQELADAFKRRNGSIICRELLGLTNVQADDSPQPEPRTPAYYKKRPCALLAQDAAEILEAYIKENPPKER